MIKLHKKDGYKLMVDQLFASMTGGDQKFGKDCGVGLNLQPFAYMSNNEYPSKGSYHTCIIRPAKYHTLARSHALHK